MDYEHKFTNIRSALKAPGPFTQRDRISCMADLLVIQNEFERMRKQLEAVDHGRPRRDKPSEDRRTADAS